MSADNDPHALKSLALYGEILDDMEGAKRPVSARGYRKAAVYALQALRRVADAPTPEVSELIASSPALGELLENIRFEQRYVASKAA